MHRAKKDAAEAVGEAAGVCRHNESQRWLDMRVGSPEDCCRDPPVVTQPPTSSATEESEGAPPLTAGLAAHRPTKHPLEHLYKYKYKGDLLQVVNAPGGARRERGSYGLPPSSPIASHSLATVGGECEFPQCVRLLALITRGWSKPLQLSPSHVTAV